MAKPTLSSCGGASGYTFYLGACQHAFPCPNTDATWTTYPGPTSMAGGLAGYFRVTPPPPVTAVPMTFAPRDFSHWQAISPTPPAAA